jgi:hypothetical protein
VYRSSVKLILSLDLSRIHGLLLEGRNKEIQCDASKKAKPKITIEAIGRDFASFSQIAEAIYLLTGCGYSSPSVTACDLTQ